MTTRQLWSLFEQAGVMVHCVSYEPLADLRDSVCSPLSGEVICCPANVQDVPIPNLVVARAIDQAADPLDVARLNASVAELTLRQLTTFGLSFRFSDETCDRPFRFDGPNPNVIVEADESVWLDGMPVTVRLSTTWPCPRRWRASAQ